MIIFAMPLVGLSSNSRAAGRLGELVFVFSEKKLFTYSENPKKNTLTLNFANVRPSELDALERYDERVIKRALVREFGLNGSQVVLTLRDHNLKATIDELTEPYRIAVQIFDHNYSYDTDPQTGLPKTNLDSMDKSGTKEKQSDSRWQAGLATDKNRGSIQSENNTEIPSFFQRGIARKENDGKLKLLKPQIKALEKSEDATVSIEKQSAGRGAAWKTYPVFSYPTQVAALGESQLNASSQGISHEQALADFSFKQFSFGHEKRALAGYQQVLHKDPRLFRKDVHHLWAFAEAHFGQKNLSLADGYFDLLIEQFPVSAHAQHAYLRKLDIKAIQFLEAKQEAKLASLLPALKRLSARNNSEIAAQIAIRSCYWQEPMPASFTNDLAICNKGIISQLKDIEQVLESRKTRFIVQNILLQDALAPEIEWNQDLELRANQYFKTYDQRSGAPFYKHLKKRYIDTVNANIVRATREKNDSVAVGIDRNLSREFNEVRFNTETSDSLARSYRRLGQDRQALKYYDISEKKHDEAVKKFEATLWVAILSSRLGTVASSQNMGNTPAQTYRSKARAADLRLGKIWVAMNASTQHEIRNIFHEDLKSTLSDQALLKTPPKILLSSWKSALETESSQDEQNEGTLKWADNFSDAALQVRLLRDLINRFKKLGLDDERRQATQLLKLIKPENLSDDREAQDLWTNQLVALADEYRENSEYLKAGRLYTYTASEAIDWEDRAESLYKGGLLLYRAGKREEAIKSLTQASQDGNNLFYANLAKERLTQLRP